MSLQDIMYCTPLMIVRVLTFLPLHLEFIHLNSILLCLVVVDDDSLLLFSQWRKGEEFLCKISHFEARVVEED